MILDANVLVSLLNAEHEGHATATSWLAAQARFSTCPLLQLAALRLSTVAHQVAPEDARKALRQRLRDPRHRFLADDVAAVDSPGTISGQNQWNDAYLAGLATRHSTKVVTFDKSFSRRHPGATVLLIAKPA